jgi:hypothetical protein
VTFAADEGVDDKGGGTFGRGVLDDVLGCEGGLLGGWDLPGMEGGPDFGGGFGGDWLDEELFCGGGLGG